MHFEKNLTEANIIIMDISVVRLLEKYRQHFYSFTEDFVPFVVDNQYNEKLNSILHSISDNEVKQYTDKHLGDEISEMRPFAFVTTEFCM